MHSVWWLMWRRFLRNRLAVGGAKPVILIQNTGLQESGDSLRGWAIGMNIPVVLMVGYRGYTHHGDNLDTAATAIAQHATIFVDACASPPCCIG